MQNKALTDFWKTISIILLSVLLFSGVSTYVILSIAIKEEKQTLLNNAQVLANLIGSVAAFDQIHSKEAIFNYDSDTATLQQVNNALNQLTATKDEYEYLIGTLDANEIDYISYSGLKPPYIPLNQKNIAIPMRLALAKNTGVVRGLDYKGDDTLAAFMPIKNTPWGLVVKHNYDTFAQPYYNAGMVVLILTSLLSTIIFIVVRFKELQYRKQMQAQETRFQQLVESTDDWVWELNEAGVYTYVSNQCQSLLGYTPAEIIGKTPFDFMPEKEAQLVRQDFEKISQQKEAFQNLSNTVIHKDGFLVHLLTSGAPYFDSRGHFLGYRGIDKDISEIKHHQQKIENLAYFDDLTKLSNREQILLRLEEEINFCSHHQTLSSLYYLDLDGFKDINDSLGHDFGDEVLIEIAKRLKQLTRNSDTVGRLGGDEFVIILRSAHIDKQQLHDDLLTLGQRIIQAINQPIILNDKSMHVGASIGVALIPEDGDNVHELLRHADSAMYESKQAGKNQLTFYHDQFQQAADRKMQFKSELIHAFEHHEFELFYQKQFDITGTQLKGLEALIRWHHPVKGYISPFDFLKYIEEFHLSERLDHWVVEQACKDIESTFSNHLEEDASVSINVTSDSFAQEAFSLFILECCTKYHVKPSMLSIEITEDSIVRNISETSSMINNMQKAGFKVYIDDFGTGYSSLSYLSKMNFTSIKIDKTFIQKINHHEPDRLICKLIVRLAQDLNKNVIAEGVETQEQLDFLHDLNVSCIQGFIYAKPIPLKELSF